MIYIFLFSSPERYKMINDNNSIASCEKYIKREFMLNPNLNNFRKHDHEHGV